MIIVTGATGFIGSAFVWNLNHIGIENIVCVDDYGTGEKWRNLSKRRFFDFVKIEDIQPFLEKNSKEIEWIIHMGANSSTTETDGDAIFKSNYEYTKNLFEWCTKNNKHFMYASSAATYGDGRLGYDDNTASSELKPLNLYGYSKVLFDRHFEMKRQLEQKLPPTCIGIKFFNVFGPNEYHKGDMSSVVFKSFHQIQKNGGIKLFKSHRQEFRDGEQMRDFVYVKEVTHWMQQLMDKKNIHGIFNMGYGKARTWLDLSTQVFKNMNKPVKIDYIDIPENLRDKYQYFTEAKISKLVELGLDAPSWNLEKGIQDYVQNYLLKEDPYL